MNLNDFVALKSHRNINGSLVNEIVVLLEFKSLDNLGLDTLLIAVAWGRSKTYTELLFYKLCEVLWLVKHESI